MNKARTWHCDNCILKEELPDMDICSFGKAKKLKILRLPKGKLKSCNHNKTKKMLINERISEVQRKELKINKDVL